MKKNQINIFKIVARLLFQYSVTVATFYSLRLDGRSLMKEIPAGEKKGKRVNGKPPARRINAIFIV